MAERTFDARYFDDAYEREKYAATIAALDGARFSNGFEIGCSIGVLTGQLARVCDRLLAVDFSEQALALARRRNAGVANVHFARLDFPKTTPQERFDFIIVSEVGYYWSDAELAQARERIVALAPGGCIELVHFTPYVAEHVRAGDAVHEAFLADARFASGRAIRHERYRIDVLRVR